MIAAICNLRQDNQTYAGINPSAADLRKPDHRSPALAAGGVGRRDLAIFEKH